MVKIARKYSVKLEKANIEITAVLLLLCYNYYMAYILNKRTIFLLIILSIVSFFAFQHFSKQYITTNWNQPLIVTIFPVNENNDPEIQNFVDQVTPAQFQQSVDFLQHQSAKYGIHTQPIIKIERGQKLKDQNIPLLPNNEKNTLNNLIWSVKLRWWAYKNAVSTNNDNHIKIFILYHKVTPGQLLPHSSAVKMGYTALVYAFAGKNQIASNNVVFTHELLHTIGAADRYDSNLQPVYPDGYAYPNNIPLYPQEQCEIMAPYLALTKHSSKPIQNLNNCIIGPETAYEIGWW